MCILYMTMILFVKIEEIVLSSEYNIIIGLYSNLHWPATRLIVHKNQKELICPCFNLDGLT